MYMVDVACVGGREGGIFYLVYRIGEYDVRRHVIYVLAICVYCGAVAPKSKLNQQTK